MSWADLDVKAFWGQGDTTAAGCPSDWTSMLHLARDKDITEADLAAHFWEGNTFWTDDDGKFFSTFYRTREGIERFFITDINNPAASATAQSELPVMLDCIGSLAPIWGDRTQVARFNHAPGGSNVLYMDGHVEYVKYGAQPIPTYVWDLGFSTANLNYHAAFNISRMGGWG
jgi:prepilin-type processing-associated H-X9-DG protein